MIQGAQQLRSRLAALSEATSPIGEAWGRETVAQARRRITRRTGATAASLRLLSATENGARIVGSPVAVILDRGARAHDIEARSAQTLTFRGRGGRPVFAKKVHQPRQQGSRFLTDAATDGLRKSKPMDQLIAAWNEAA